MNDNLRNVIYQYQYEICYFNKKQLFAQAENEKDYYVKLIKERTEALVEYLKQDEPKVQEVHTDEVTEKVFSTTELAQFDGHNGSPVYVAVNGNVYDVTKISVWGSGTHFGLTPGKDLTKEFMECHGGLEDILKKLPKVGTVK